MIRSTDILDKFEADFISGRLGVGKLSRKAASRIFEGMWKEAVRLGVFPSKNPLEGIDVDIKIARKPNSSSNKLK